jgi:8-oxo-dGTP pyrophosphatase MutT (NUDIX family)
MKLAQRPFEEVFGEPAGLTAEAGLPCMMPRRNLRAVIGVKALMFQNDHVLLLRRAPLSHPYSGFWDLPGGAVEDGEDLRKAIVREVREETGFTVRPTRLVEVSMFEWWIDPTKKSKGVAPGLNVSYECTIRSHRRILLDPNEHSEWKWVDRQHLRQHRMRPPLSRVVRIGFALRWPQADRATGKHRGRVPLPV